MASKLQPLFDGDIYKRLWRARQLMDDCYDRPLNLEELSREACFSRYHFIRLFKQAFDKTPHQYLINKRIERAKELLARSELRVTDVCFEVGFQSLGSFSAMFHRHVGTSPIIYRTNLTELSHVALASEHVWIPFCFERMYGAGQSFGAAH